MFILDYTASEHVRLEGGSDKRVTTGNGKTRNNTDRERDRLHVVEEEEDYEEEKQQQQKLRGG